MYTVSGKKTYRPNFNKCKRISTILGTHYPDDKPTFYYKIWF